MRPTLYPVSACGLLRRTPGRIWCALHSRHRGPDRTQPLRALGHRVRCCTMYCRLLNEASVGAVHTLRRTTSPRHECCILSTYPCACAIDVSLPDDQALPASHLTQCGGPCLCFCIGADTYAVGVVVAAGRLVFDISSDEMQCERARHRRTRRGRCSLAGWYTCRSLQRWAFACECHCAHRGHRLASRPHFSAQAEPERSESAVLEACAALSGTIGECYLIGVRWHTRSGSCVGAHRVDRIVGRFRRTVTR